MSPRTCPLCGQPILPGESTLVPFQAWVDDGGRQLGTDRDPSAAIHTRCKLADPDAAARHVAAVFDDGAAQ